MCAAVLGIVAAGQGAVSTQPDDKAMARKYHATRICGQAADLEAAEAIASEHGLRVLKTFKSLSKEVGHWCGVWELDPQRRALQAGAVQPTVEAVVSNMHRLRSSKLKFANLDKTIQASTSPNDPEFPKQWALHNTGQNGGTAGADVKAVEAWDIETGSSDQVVAIIDTGIAYGHPDLKPNLWVNKDEIPGNGIDDDGNGYVDDVYGINAIKGSGDNLDDNNHGSHCAGIIGAAGNNGIGISGINPKVKLMGLKFLDSGASGYWSDAAECLDYVIAMKKKGVNIVVTSNSWIGTESDQNVEDAFTVLGGLGVVSVVAAGNQTKDVDTNQLWPANTQNKYVIAVGNSTSKDELASSSNWGAKNVKLFAPGTDILSTGKGTTYLSMTGTSMSCPLVAGAISLAANRFPSESAELRMGRVLANVDKVSAFAGKCSSGGRLNVYNMVAGGEYLNANFASTVSLDSLTVVFQDRTLSSTGEVTSWSWSFGDNTTSTTQNPTHTYAAPGTYTVTLTVNDANNKPKTTSSVIQVPRDPAYSESQSFSSGSSGITKVQIGTFSHESGNSNYTLYDAEKVPLVAGQKYDVVVTCKPNPFGTQFLRLWIDYNRNESFEDSGELVFQQSGTTSFTGSFTVPEASVLNSPVGVRFSVKDSQYPTPCANNGWGEVEDYRAILSKGEAKAPSILTHPANVTVNEGRTATFTVVASGTNPLSYQWNKSGTAISGATSASYTTPATSTTDDGARFAVVVSNAQGSVTSNEATLQVLPEVAPTITTHPAATSVTVGQSATFRVVASGSGTLSYQWTRNGSAISGANSSSYTTPATVMGDDGAKFACVVSNPKGSATSNEATLTVVPLPSNLALKKTASASGTYSSYVPANAFDGVADLTNQRTYWSVSTGTKTQWLQVDLGTAQSVGKAKLTFSKTNYPKSYSIQYLNGTTWTSVYSTTAGQGGANSAVSFGPVTAQKWRIYATAANGSYYSVYEFELYP